MQLQLQESRELPKAPPSHPCLPHLNVALGFMQAVQSELQVGAPSRHYAGAGHIAELSHCFQKGPPSWCKGEETQGVSKDQGEGPLTAQMGSRTIQLKAG